MKQTIAVCVLASLLLNACDQNTVDIDPKMAAIAVVRDNYYKENREAIDAQSARLFRESPELASYLTVAEATRAILLECEEVCTPVRIVSNLGQLNLNLGPNGCPANQASLGERIEGCGSETDSEAYGECVTGAIRGGVCN